MLVEMTLSIHDSYRYNACCWGYTDDEWNGKELYACNVVLDARLLSTQFCSSDARFNGLDEDLLCSADLLLLAAPFT